MATIITINATDIVKNSRETINTNFTNLNNDKAEKSEVRDSSYSYAADTGTANAYAVVLSPVPTVYTTGMRVIFKAANANTGVSTLNVNNLGIKAIKKFVSQDLAANDITAGAIVEVVYDGTNFQFLGLAPGAVYTSGDQTIAGAKTFTGAVTLSSGNAVLTSGDQTIAGIKTFSSIPILPASNPTNINEATRKAYVDTKIGGLGSWVSRNNDTVYQAEADGFVVVYGNSGGLVTEITGYTDSSNPPTTIRAQIQGGDSGIHSITFPVKKNDYYKVSFLLGTNGVRVIYWIPFT